MTTLVPILCLLGSLLCAAKAVASLSRAKTVTQGSVARAHGERGCHASANDRRR